MEVFYKEGNSPPSLEKSRWWPLAALVSRCCPWATPHCHSVERVEGKHSAERVGFGCPPAGSTPNIERSHHVMHDVSHGPSNSWTEYSWADMSERCASRVTCEADTGASPCDHRGTGGVARESWARGGEVVGHWNISAFSPVGFQPTLEPGGVDLLLWA